MGLRQGVRGTSTVATAAKETAMAATVLDAGDKSGHGAHMDD